MRRSRTAKDNVNAASSIPRMSTNNRRSSSVDCVIRRGSYLPQNRRGSSVERYKPPGSAMKLSRASPKICANSLFPPPRGSNLDRKRTLKDQRPLSDKAYQKKCIATLVEFLEESNFPFVISPSNLMPPQKKDFENIFQFLYNVLDPKYEVKKIEEEAPKILKGLGYPFVLTKSSFLSITRMSWPTLLGTLLWLVDLNKIIASINLGNYVAENDFDEVEKLSIFLNYVLHSYKAGVVDPVKDEEIFTNLATKTCSGDLSSDEMVEKISQLEIAIDKKKEEQKEYGRIEEYIKTAEDDKEIYEEYVCKMMNHMKQKQETLQKLKEQQAEKENELQSLLKLVDEKEALYKAQGYDGQCAQNFFAAKKSSLNEKLSEKQIISKENEEACWDLEIKLSELRDKLDASCQDFNLTWEDLRNTLENALVPLNCTTIPAAVKLYKEYKVTLPELQVSQNSVIQDLKSALEKVRKHIEEHRESMQNIVVIQKRHISELEVKASDICIKQQMSSAVLNQKERELEAKITEDEREIEAIQIECDMQEKKLRSICDQNARLKQTNLELKKTLEELRIRLTETQSSSMQKISSHEKCTKEVSKLVEESCKRIQTEAVKLFEEMKTLLKEIEETPS